MAAVRIRLKATAFDPAGPLEGLEARGSKRVYGSHLYALPSVFVTPISVDWNAGGHGRMSTFSSRKSITVDINGVETTSVLFNSLPVEGFRQHLAVDVERGILEILKDGVAQTAAQVLAGV